MPKQDATSALGKSSVSSHQIKAEGTRKRGQLSENEPKTSFKRLRVESGYTPSTAFEPLSPSQESIDTSSPSETMAPTPSVSRVMDVDMADSRRIGNFVVDMSLKKGKLPVFGQQAEELIINLKPKDVDLAVASKFASRDELEFWKELLSRHDSTQVFVEQKKRKGKSRQVTLRSLVNIKISEHWSYKAKTLFKTMNNHFHFRSEVTYEDLQDGALISAIANWVQVAPKEIDKNHVTLTVWRINKKVNRRTLRDDVQAARKHVRGKRLDVSEFEIARKKWRLELKTLKVALFPNGNTTFLESGKRAAMRISLPGRLPMVSKPSPSAEPVPPPSSTAAGSTLTSIGSPPSNWERPPVLPETVSPTPSVLAPSTSQVEHISSCNESQLSTASGDNWLVETAMSVSFTATRTENALEPLRDSGMTLDLSTMIDF